MKRLIRKVKQRLVCNWGVFVSLFFLLLCIIYVVLKKDDIYIQIWDNLDSNVAWIKMLKDNNLFFTNDTIVPFLGGISRDYLYSYFSVYALICIIMPVFYGLVFNWTVCVILSIFGMVCLSKELSKPNHQIDSNISAICGLIYGIMATFPTASYSFSALPFLFTIIIKIYKEPTNIKYYLILAICPLFIDLFLFGVFICGYILLFTIFDYIKTRKLKKGLLLAIFILFVSYIIIDNKILKLLLFSNSTIRSDGSSDSYNSSIIQVIINSLKAFKNGVDHADAGQKYFILPFSLLYFSYVLIKAIKQKDIKSFFAKYSFWVLLVIVFNSIICGIDDFSIFRLVIKKIFPFLSEFSFARTLWFNPLLWILLLLLIISESRNKKWQVVVCVCTFISVLYNDARYNAVGTNIRRELGLKSSKGTETTYSDYYSCDLFEKIKQDIDYNDEWSVAFGMHPAIIQYNGIHTLDGYLSYYSAEYKSKFREIIEPELIMDEKNREYFDNGGGRAYIFSQETHYNTWKENYNNKEANIYINTNKFAELGGKYIFSIVKIKNNDQMKLKLVNEYSDTKSTYTIYLYIVDFNKLLD